MNAAVGKRRTVVLLALVVAVVAAAALVLDRFHAGLDLTSSRRYSLSTISRNLYKDLPDHLRITYYISPELEARHPGPREVEDFLRKYEAAGRGKISVATVDPKDRTGAIEGLGLQPQRMQVVENNQARVVVVYSGIVVQYRDRTEAIPFVLGLDTLEYDLVKAVNRAVSGKEAIAAVIVGDQDKSWQNDFRSLADTLAAAGWKAQAVAPGDEIPDAAQVLLVLGNADLDDYAAYRIDAWLAKGGAAVLALRGVRINTAYGLQAAPLKQDAVLRELAAYGVTLAPKLVLDTSSRILPFQERNASGGSSVRYIKYPHWIVARPEDSNRKNPMTAHFAGLDLMWASPLTLAAPAGVTAEELVKTTKTAWLQTKDFAIAPEDEMAYDREEPATKGQYLLAASLSGKLPIAFAGRPAPARQGAKPLPPLPAEASPSHLVVVGSADFATDLMNLSDSGYNAGFLANAVEWAAYGPDLTALKSRGAREQSLSKVADPVKRSLLSLFVMGLNIVVIPGGLVVFGLVRSRRRKALARLHVEPAGQAAVVAADAPPPDDAGLDGKGDGK
jgi:ABC-2 type transport system permease protein